jgi:UDP-N-acetylglucosamine acyltransferase
VIFQERRNLTHALEFIEIHFEKTLERDEIVSFIRNSARGIIKGCKE